MTSRYKKKSTLVNSVVPRENATPSLVRMAAQREESRRHWLDVEDAIAGGAKGLCPFARQRFWHARIARQTKSDQMAFVCVVIHEAVSSVEDCRVVDKV